MSAVDVVAGWIWSAVKAVVGAIVWLSQVLLWPAREAWGTLDPQTVGGELLSAVLALCALVLFWAACILAALLAFQGLMSLMDYLYRRKYSRDSEVT